MGTDYSGRALWSRRVMWLGFGLSLVMITLNTLVIPSCQRQPNVVVWALSLLPLIVFMPALIRHWLRACAWLCFILLFYFLLAVNVAMTCSSLATGLEVVSVVVLFVATMLYIRWQSRLNKQQAAPAAELEESINNG